MARKDGTHPTHSTIMYALVAYTLLAVSLHTVPDSLPGRYTLDPGAGDDPAQVAQRATRDLGRLARGRMRSALEEAMTPSRTLEIRLEGGAYLVVQEAGRSIRVVPGGPEVEQETPRGERAWISGTVEAGSLVLRMRTDKGERLQTLSPNPDGLRVRTRYSLDRLREPVTMEAIYRRDKG